MVDTHVPHASPHEQHTQFTLISLLSRSHLALIRVPVALTIFRPHVHLVHSQANACATSAKLARSSNLVLFSRRSPLSPDGIERVGRRA
eukprot:6180553-Pleurochrysis_carterae.AAC.1